MLRVFRNADGSWWRDAGFSSSKDVNGVYANSKHRVTTLDEWPEPISYRVFTLSLMEPGVSVPGVGRRVSDDTFWVYEPQSDEENTMRWTDLPASGPTTTLHDVESIRVLPARTLSLSESPTLAHHRTIEIVQNFNGKLVRSTIVCFAEERENLEVLSDD